MAERMAERCAERRRREFVGREPELALTASLLRREDERALPRRRSKRPAVRHRPR